MHRILFLLSSAFLVAAAAPYQLAGIVIQDEATVHYSRSIDFGGWRHNPGDCMDTRNRILADESVPNKLRIQDCIVRVGLWVDPYTGKSFTDPRKLDIDHLVPLAEAWRSGAWSWSKAKRIEYANDISDPEHLIAVSLIENRKKGDRDPAGYMPPLATYRCLYLTNWVTVKRRWSLSMDKVESSIVNNGLIGC